MLYQKNEILLILNHTEKKTEKLWTRVGIETTMPAVADQHLHHYATAVFGDHCSTKWSH